jgi:DNA polymerase-3 subunit alpha
MERALESVQQLKKDRASGQVNMFDMFAASGQGGIDKVYLDVPEWPEKERLGFERESVGFYLSGHPLDRYVDDAKKLGAIPTTELVQQRHNSEAQIVGIVASLRERPLKTGDGRWAIVVVEDTFGQAEVLAFSKVYEEAEAKLKSGEPILVRGRALIDDINDEGQQLTPKMRAESIELLAEEQIKRTRWLELHLDIPARTEAAPLTCRFDPNTEEHRLRDETDPRITESLERIRALCAERPGQTPARLQLTMPAGYTVTIACSDELLVYPDERLILELERIRGVAQVTRC